MPQQCSSPNCSNTSIEVLCRNCVDNLRRDLRQIPDLWAELDTTRLRLSKTSVAQEGRSANKPLPWNEHTAQVATDLFGVLVAWARDIHTAGDTDPRDPLHMAIMHPAHTAQWLSRNFNALLRLEDIGDFVDALTNALVRARRAIDLPALRTRFKVGPCPEVLEDGNCSGEVWAYIPGSDDKPAWMKCNTCTSEWDTTQWLRAGERMLRIMDEQRKQVELGQTENETRRCG